MKVCWTCKQEFPATPEFFHNDKSRPDGLNHQCKSCSSKKNQTWRKANKNRNKEYWLMARYKLSYEQYIDYMSLHNWQCDICGGANRLCIDHDHACCPGKESCGKCIRGVLCHVCNSALGYINDDISNLTKMILYLKGELINV